MAWKVLLLRANFRRRNPVPPARLTHLLLILVTASTSLLAGGAEWMTSLPDSAPLSALPIPGTHNSAALHEPVRSTAACQDLTVPAQLDAGVRFLDIRCRHVDDGLAIHHGIISQKTTFDAVVRDVLAFLDRHPGETVILSIQETTGAERNTRSFPATVDAHIAEHADRWLTGSAIPALGEARGKIVLFRRYEGSSRGIDATGWESGRSPHLRVQDRFRVTDVDEKWRAITAMFDETQAGPPDTLFINFTSGVRSGAFGIPDIRSVSDAINPRLADWLRENPTRRRSVVVMDFVTPELCGLIVDPAAGSTGDE